MRILIMEFNDVIKIPPNWNGPSPGKTRTTLLEDYK
jgi:hypothetical protein